MSESKPIPTPSTDPSAHSQTDRTDLVVGPVNPLQPSNWDAWVKTAPRAGFFHSSAWARVLTDTYGFAPVYLAATRAGVMRGALPLMEVDSWLTGRRGVGLPFTDECEPLCADADTFQTLFQSALALGRARGWKHVECRGGREFLPGVPPALEHYTHELTLSADESALFAGLDGAVRRAIRKAGKEGVSVEISRDLEAVKVFYQLQGQTRRRHGLPPQPFTWFRNIHRQVLAQNMGIVVVARKGHTPVSAAVYFHWGGQAVYKYGASDQRFQHLRGSNLVMWAAIKWFAGQGLDRLHLGRTSLVHAGLRQFKLGWGARETRLAYYKFDLLREQFVVERDETAGWHNRFFRLAPVALARLAGRMLYRHWA